MIRIQNLNTNEFVTKNRRQAKQYVELITVHYSDGRSCKGCKTKYKHTKGIAVGYRTLQPVIIIELIYADDLILCAPTTLNYRFLYEEQEKMF